MKIDFFHVFANFYHKFTHVFPLSDENNVENLSFLVDNFRKRRDSYYVVLIFLNQHIRTKLSQIENLKFCF